MGAIDDILSGMTGKPDTTGSGSSKSKNKQPTKKSVQLDDVTNVIGALSGNKQDKLDLMERAKGLIPGTLDDTVIDLMKKGVKGKSSK